MIATLCCGPIFEEKLLSEEWSLFNFLDMLLLSKDEKVGLVTTTTKYTGFIYSQNLIDSKWFDLCKASIFIKRKPRGDPATLGKGYYKSLRVRLYYVSAGNDFFLLSKFSWQNARGLKSFESLAFLFHITNIRWSREECLWGFEYPFPTFREYVSLYIVRPSNELGLQDGLAGWLFCFVRSSKVRQFSKGLVE